MRFLPLGLTLLLCGLAPGQDDLVPGVTLRTYLLDHEPERIPRLVADQTPNVDVVRSRIDFDAVSLADLGGPTYSTVTGFLVVEAAGSHEFRLTSDDGARLSIGKRIVCDHDGRHGATAKTGETVDLAAGRHAFEIEHFDGGGNRRLLLEWRGPSAKDWDVIPERALLTEADPTRVTSPGVKRVSGQRRPGDGRPLGGVHPAWAVQTIRPEGFEPRVGAMAFLADGRLLVGTFDPLQRDEVELPDITKKKPDSLYAVSGLESENPSKWRVDVVAGGLHEPAGVCVVGTDVYVAHRGRITRLRDEDGDGRYETMKDVASGWEGWNYHQFSLGLLHRDGKLYSALSTAMAPPAWEGMGTNAAPNGPMQGAVIEVDLSSETARVIAGGMRSPNGLGFGPGGSLFYADNQGTWMSTSQLAEVIPGRFYGHYNRTDFVPKLATRYPDGGHPSSYCDRLRTTPAVWLPQNEVCNSPTVPLLIPSGEFAGQMLLGELTAGGIRRVFLEEVDGQWQGALFRFTQGLEAGVNRMTWGPDGSLYVGCIGAGGNWSWRGRRFGLQRLVPTGKSAFEMKTVKALPGGEGFEIEFSRRVARGWLEQVENFEVTQWRYEPTKNYGGPKIDVERLRVAKATASPSGFGVRLSVAGLREGRCVHLVTDPTSMDGETIWSTEVWYTLARFPRTPRPARPVFDAAAIDASAVGLGILPPPHGVPLLSRSAWPAFKQGRGGIPRDGRRTQDDLMKLSGEIALTEITGDLVTAAELGDCRLHVERFEPAGGKAGNAGRSGIFIQDRHEIRVPSIPSGEWQAYDAWFRATRWEEGRKVADPRLTLFLNGEIVHDDLLLADGGPPRDVGVGVRTRTGPLALRRPKTGAGGPVLYRNLWVAPLKEPKWVAGPWQDLFGEDTETTIVGGEARFEHRDGEIIGTTRPNTTNTFLTTSRDYGDFDLIFEVKVDAELNSGVQIRSRDVGAGLQGYQVEIDPSPRRYSGGIYDERRRGWLYPLIDAPHARRAWRYGAWNRIEVRARGPIIRTWVNGVPAADLFDAVSPSGRIGLQVHGVGARQRPLEVRWRNIRIRELRKM